jgi:threonine aldolase
MNFASDNTSPAHPSIMSAVAVANEGYAMPYGADPWMDEVRAEIRRQFEAPEAAVYLVATGTAANALALACLCPPWAAVYCHRNAHVEEDECGAPEFYTGGAKLVLIDGDHARMSPAGLSRAVAFTARAGVHNVQKGMVTLTNSTENGAVYTPAQVAELAAIAHAQGLPVHMDGARFANALVAAGCTPSEMTWRAGVDVLSFGGTKNGCLGVEAVVIFDPAKAWEFELRRKRGGHLFSKHRYLSAQMEAYLDGDLWLGMARAANAAAARLAAGLRAAPGATLAWEPQANVIFARLPRRTHQRLIAAGAVYSLWEGDADSGDPEEPLLARFVCDWSTPAASIDGLLGLLAG